MQLSASPPRRHALTLLGTACAILWSAFPALSTATALPTDLVDADPGLGPVLVLLPSPPDALAKAGAALNASPSRQAATAILVQQCLGPGFICDNHPTDPSLYKCKDQYRR
jgi:hypothetical protein